MAEWFMQHRPLLFSLSLHCAKNIVRERDIEIERERRNSNNNNGNFSYDIFGFCALRGHSTAKSTKDARLHLSITAGGGAALLDGMGWVGMVVLLLRGGKL